MTPGLLAQGNLKSSGSASRDRCSTGWLRPATTASRPLNPGAHSVWGPEVTGIEGMTMDIGGAGAILKTQSTRNLKVNDGTSMTAQRGEHLCRRPRSLKRRGTGTTSSTSWPRRASMRRVLFGSRQQGAGLGPRRHHPLQPAIHYDKTMNRNIIFVGSNDDFMHCFTDNDQGTADNLEDDTVQESWAFMPVVSCPTSNICRQREAQTLYPGIQSTSTVDGSPWCTRARPSNNVSVLRARTRRQGLHRAANSRTSTSS